MFSAYEQTDVRRVSSGSVRRAYVNTAAVAYGRVGAGDNCANRWKGCAIPTMRVLPVGSGWIAGATPVTDIWGDDGRIGERDVVRRRLGGNDDREA